MEIQQLIKQLQSCIDEKSNKPTDVVVFHHTIIDHSGKGYSEVDYILTAQKPNSLVLCYDDGHF